MRVPQMRLVTSGGHGPNLATKSTMGGGAIWRAVIRVKFGQAPEAGMGNGMALPVSTRAYPRLYQRGGFRAASERPPGHAKTFLYGNLIDQTASVTERRASKPFQRSH